MTWARTARGSCSRHCGLTSLTTSCSTELYSVSPSGGEATKLNTFDMAVEPCRSARTVNNWRLWPAATEPVASYTQPDLWITDVSPNAKPRNMTALNSTYDFGSGVFGDSAAPRGGGGNKPIMGPDGKSMLDQYGKEGRTILAAFDAHYWHAERSDSWESGGSALPRECRMPRKLFILSPPRHRSMIFLSSMEKVANHARSLTLTTSYSQSLI
jgi:hypothetical protein